MHHVLVIVEESGDVDLAELVDEAWYVRDVLVFVAEVDVLVVNAPVARVASRQVAGPRLICRPPQTVQASLGVDVIVERVLTS